MEEVLEQTLRNEKCSHLRVRERVSEKGEKVCSPHVVKDGKGDIISVEA